MGEVRAAEPIPPLGRTDMTDAVRNPIQIRQFTCEQLLGLAVFGDEATRLLIDDELDGRAVPIHPSCPDPLSGVDAERAPLLKPLSTGFAAG